MQKPSKVKLQHAMQNALFMHISYRHDFSTSILEYNNNTACNIWHANCYIIGESTVKVHYVDFYSRLSGGVATPVTFPYGV
jgi:hypothetical protein